MSYNYQAPARDRSDSQDSFASRYAPTTYGNDAHQPLPYPAPAYAPSGPAGYQQPLSEDRVASLPSEVGIDRSASVKFESNTITPLDSISNVGGDEYYQSTASRAGGGGFGASAAARSDPFRDPAVPGHGQTRQLSGVIEEEDDDEAYRGYEYGPNDREQAGYGAHESTTKLPLVGNAALPYRGREHDSDEEGSFVDGDTIVGTNARKAAAYRSSQPNAGHQSRDSQSGLLPEDNNAYPPAPYDSLNDDDNDYYSQQRNKEKENGGEDVERGGLSKIKRLMLGGKGDEEARRGGDVKRPNVFLRQVWDSTPTQEKIRLHKAGVGVQDRPWMCYLISIVITSVLIYELARSASVTGSAFAPFSQNYMGGPRSEMLINLGSRFTACMRDIPAISSMPFQCLNSTTSSRETCTLEEICGLGGFEASGKPGQTFRFFTALWLHVGIIHLLLNMLVLLTSSGLVEKQMGSLKFLIVYIFAGLFGFILGGNFSLPGIAAMGASGGIFGTHAAVLVDLCAHWSLISRPGRLLLALLVEIIIGFAIGYVPGIDNMSHIGGFAMGLLLSFALLPMIHQSRSHRIVFLVLRLISFVGAVVLLAVLTNNFFQKDPSAACSGCVYLSCWPTAANDRCRGTGLQTTTGSTTSSDTNDGTVGGATTNNVNVALAAIYLVRYAGTQLRRRMEASAIRERQAV